MKRVTPSPRLGAPRETVESPRQSLLAKARHRLHRLTITAMFVLALGFTLLVSTGTSQEATAATNSLVAIGPGKCDFAPSQNQHWEPSEPGSGSDGFLYPSEYINEGSAATPLEKYGMRGMNWSLTSYSGNVKDVNSDDNQDCQFMAPIQNMLAQEMLTASQSVASITIAVRQKATDAGPFMRMLRDATPTTNDALTKWFIPGAGLMVVITGVWMVAKSTGGERRSVMAGFGWMVGAILIVGWLMMPTSLANGRSGSTCQGKECDIAFGGGTSGSDGVGEGETPIYSTDPNYYALTAKANDTGNDIANTATGIFAPRTTSTECSQAKGQKDAGARTLDCVLWYEMAFRPWSVGQFGGLGESEIAWVHPNERKTKPPRDVIKGMADTKGATKGSKPYADAEKPKAGEDVRMIMLRSQTFSWQEANATGMASDVNGVINGGRTYTGSPDRITPDVDKEDHEIWDVSTKNGQWNQVRAYMAGEQGRAYGKWSGQSGVSDRTSTAFLTLIGNVLIAAFVLVTSLLTLMWYAVVVIALMALPFVGLISIFPPAQKFLRGLGQLWIKGLILAGVFTVLQVGVGAITGAVMSSNAAFGWKVVLLFAAVLGLFKVARLAREDAFTPNLGSQGVADSADPQNSMNRLSPMLAGAGFAAGRGTARVAGRGAAKAGNAAAAKTKDGAAKVSTATKKAARSTTVTARRSGYGQRVDGKVDSMQGWVADRKRGVDRKVSGVAAKTPLAGPAVARGFGEREEQRDKRELTRSERREAREKETTDAHWAREASGTKKRMSAAAGHERLRGGNVRDNVEVDAAPTQPRVTRVNVKRPVRSGENSDTSSEQSPKRVTRRTDAAPRPERQSRPAERAPEQRPQAQPRVERAPEQRRTSQPKVEQRRRENPGGTRLSNAERQRLARETAREVALNEQRKADRDAANRAGGRGGRGR